MRKGKKIVSGALALMLAAGLSAGTGAELLTYEDAAEIFDEGPVDNLMLGQEDELLSQEDELLEADESPAEVQSSEDSGLDVIEDGRVMQGISEGVSYDDMIAAEEAAEEARMEAERAGLAMGEIPYLRPADAQKLRAHLEKLMELAGPTGSDGEMEAAAYIGDQLYVCGYDMTQQPFHEGFLNASYIDVPGINVLAERGANSENRNRRILLVTAHYDTKTPEETPEAQTEGALAEEVPQTEPESEWNDTEEAWQSMPLMSDPTRDLTGAAVMIETAAILSDVQTDMDVCFVFLSGEEDGYYGSLRFVESLSEELRSRICGVISIGTLGAKGYPVLLGTGDGLSNIPTLLIRAAATQAEAEALIEGAFMEEIAGITTNDWTVVKHGSGIESLAGEVNTWPAEEPETEESGEEAPTPGTAGRFIDAGFEQVVSVGQYPADQVVGADTFLSETEQDLIEGEPEITEEHADLFAEGIREEAVYEIEPERMAKAADILAEAIVRYMRSAI